MPGKMSDAFHENHRTLASFQTRDEPQSIFLEYSGETAPALCPTLAIKAGRRQILPAHTGQRRHRRPDSEWFDRAPDTEGLRHSYMHTGR